MDFAAATIRDVVAVLIGHVAENPCATIISVLGLSLSPVLGAGWMIAMPLKALGFESGGVVGGSLAAWYQSTTYGGYIPVGSMFAWLQHLGAML